MIKKDGLLEIRWHGRAGQGVVTAAELLAETALGEGKYFQAFPEYGPERMGAPIRAYTRISESPISMHCQITRPDVVAVLDPTLLGVIDVTDGLTEEGALIVNTPLGPSELRSKIDDFPGKVYTVDATRIALDTLKRNLTNTPMLGALLRVVEAVDKGSAIRTFQEKLGAKLGVTAVEANIAALERGYTEVKEG